MNKNKFELTMIFSVLLLTIILGLCGCGNNSGDVSSARRSMENGAARKIRRQFADEDVSEIVLDKDVTVMGCIVVNGEKKVSGAGKIILDPVAKAGIYQDLAALNEENVLTEDDLAQMTESSVLFVNNGAKLTLAGDIVIDSNQAGNGVMIAKGGEAIIAEKASFMNGNYCNLYNEGKVSLDGGSFAAAKGYNIINEGTLIVNNGDMDASKSLGNIYNLEGLTVSGGTIQKATIHNIYVADGSAVFNGGYVLGARKSNIYISETSKVEIEKGVAIQNGTTGITNYGTLKLDGAKIERNLTQLANYGKADIDKSEMLNATVDHIVNGETGTLKITDTNLTTSGARALVNNKGKVSFKTLGVRRTGGNAVCNNGGNLIGEQLLIYGASGTALDNMDAVDALGGDVRIKGIEIQAGSGMNIAQESGGTMELTDVVSGITAITNIKVISGKLVLNDLEIEGTSSSGAGIWTTGGKLEVNHAFIRETKGRGMALSGGETTGKDIEFKNIANTGIDVMRHTNLYTSAKVELKNVSFSGGARDNIATTTENAELTITGGKLGKTLGNNIRGRGGVMTLNNVEVLGNKPDGTGNTSYNGVWMAEGEINMNNCVIRDPLASAIRNQGGQFNATNLKIYNTTQAAIRNDYYSDKVTYGNINIKDLEVYDAKLGAIRNDCPGTFKVTKGVFTTSPANIVMVTDGKMVIKDIEVGRALSSAKGSPYNSVYVRNGALEMTNIKMDGSDGTGIRQEAGTIVADNVTMKNIKTNNVNISGGVLTLKNSTLQQTTRTNVNLVSPGAEVIMSNTKVIGAGNTTGDAVSCVYVGPGTKATINEGTLLTKSAALSGLLVEGGTALVDEAIVKDNAQRGIKVEKKMVTDKETKEEKLYTSKVTIKNTDIYDNGNGTVSGGGVFGNGDITIIDSTIRNNVANTGGGIQCGADSNIVVKGTTIKNNETVTTGGAGHAGAIHVSTDSTIAIYGGKITGNKAAGKGEAIRVNSPNFAMYDSAVVDSNNDIYLERGYTIKTKTNGIGNTQSNPLTITSADTAVGTIVVEADTVKEAERVEDIVVCQNEKGVVVTATDFEEKLVLGDEDEVGWVARTQNTDGSYTKYLSLQAAIDAVPKNGVQTRVEVLENIKLKSPVDIAENGNRNILLTDDGNGPYTITRAFRNGTMVILRTGNVMTLEGSSKDDLAPSLVLDGGELKAGSDQAILKVGTNAHTNYHAEFTMNSGVQMTNNMNTAAGGAMFVYGTFIMNGGIIDGNSSEKEAGAIAAYPHANIAMNGGIITNNKANLAAGAIATLTANDTNGLPIKEDATITINEGAITNNTSGQNGGAIFMHANGKLFINGGTISGNTSGANGGAIYLHNNASIGTPATMEMTGGIISANNAGATGNKEGGAVYASAGASVLMTGGSMENNNAIAGSAMMLGPSNTNNVAILTMQGGTIHKHTGSVNGGTIFVHANAEFDFQGGDIKNNTITGHGAAVLVHLNKNDYGKGKHDGVGVMTMSGGTISDNTTSGNGGAVYVRGEFNMQDGIISGNTAKGSDGGGAIDVAAGGIFNMEGGKLTGNTAPAGLAVFLSPSNNNTLARMTMSGGEISGHHKAANTASHGGAIFVHSNAEFEMSGGTIKDNSTDKGDGGAIRIHYNNAAYGAGAHKGSGHMTMSGGTIELNYAERGRGGALDVAGEFLMSGGTIQNNEAKANQAGAIFLEGTGTMTMSDNANIQDNTSLKEGGAILSQAGGKFNMQGGIIIGNKATDGGAGAGGAILTYGTVIMSGGKISGNTAATNGGAIFVHANAKFDMQGGIVKDNQANMHGGAVYLHNNSSGAGSMTMSGGTITGNTAGANGSASRNGGGICTANAANTLSMTGGSVVGNTTTGNGKDVYSQGTLKMEGTADIGSVYLTAGGKRIELTAELSARNTKTEVAFADSMYVAGTEVLKGNAAIIANNYTYFKLPNGKTVSIDATGKMVAN